jgi:hypothetical protein
MGILNGVAVDEMSARGSIRDSDVAAMRRAFNEDGVISTSEAEALLSLNSACRVTDAAWQPFFIEALTDYIVHQAEPDGYIVVEKAEWLLARISCDGHIITHTELELLINVIDKARWSPPSLAAFALAQVRDAVVSGVGVTRAGQMLQPGMVGQGEIDLIRRILYAFAGDGGIAVTRAEAEVLIEINKSLAPGKCSPAWTELFVKAVGASVLSSLGHHIPPREEALRVEVWAKDADIRGAGALLSDATRGGEGGASARERIGKFLGRMVAGGAGSVWSTFRMQSSEERALARLERQRLEIVTQERIDDAECQWLIERLGKDGKLDANEIELLAYLQRESPMPHPELAAFAAQHGVAA